MATVLKRSEEQGQGSILLGLTDSGEYAFLGQRGKKDHLRLK